MSEARNPYFVDESKPWFNKESGWPDEVPKNMEFPDLSLGDVLRESARNWPDARALWFLSATVSFKELDDMVDRMATALDKIGVKKGDVVGMLLPNSIQYVVTYYAAVRIGAVASGVNPTYKPMEVLHQFKTVNTKYLVVLDALYETTVAPIIAQSPVEKVIVTNIADCLGLSGIKKMLGKLLGKIPSGPVPSTSLKFTDMLKESPNPPKVEVKGSDVATYIMTGGTTGVPKAAILSHFNCVSNALQAQKWLYKTAVGSCNVGVLPLFHSFAMTCVMNTSILVGAWQMLFPKPPPVEELLQTISDIGEEEGTMYCGAEILFQKIAEFKGIANYNVNTKLALCVSGAGPLHRPIQKAFEEKTNARLGEGYGLTEATPVVSAQPFWGERKIGTIGLPFTGTEWAIMDAAEFGKEKEMCPEGMEPDPEKHVGELCVAGPQVMVGYLNKPEETAETIIEKDNKRWLLTGDIGFMDDKGRVIIRDRKKQLIKYKGYSVFPKEVEELIGGHECVLEVAVAGLPDAETGERIKAWVVVREEWEGKISEDELRQWSKDNLTHYKVPSYIEFIDELPKTLVGKILRRELQEKDPIYKAYHEKNDA